MCYVSNLLRDPWSLQIHLDLPWVLIWGQILCLLCCWHQLFLLSISNIFHVAFWYFQSLRFSSSTYVTSLSLNDWFCQFFVFWGLKCFAVEWFLTQSFCLGCAGLNHSTMFVNSQVYVVFYSLQVSLRKTSKQRKFVTGQLCIPSSPDRKPGQLANAEHKNPLPK